MKKILVAAAFMFAPMISNAASVFVGGNEWLQVRDTSYVSFDAMKGYLCVPSADGGCASSSPLAGWFWASGVEVRALFEELIKPGTQQFNFNSYFAPYTDTDVDDLIGSPFFTLTSSNENGFSYERVSGMTRDPGSLPVIGDLFDSKDSRLQQDWAKIGLDPSLVKISNLDTSVGSWLYRPTTVPLPAAVWLLLAGIGAVGAVARRRKPALASAA